MGKLKEVTETQEEWFYVEFLDMYTGSTVVIRAKHFDGPSN